MTDSLTITICVVLGAAIIGAFIKGRTRDKCLLSYATDLVSLVTRDNKVVYGRLHVESTGLEFRYQTRHKDQDGHFESSFILYRHEFASIQYILRFHDELDAERQQEREKNLKRIYHPNFLRRTGRRIGNFFKTIRDSMMEVVNLLIDQAKRRGPAGAFLSSKDKYISRVKSDVMSTISTAYEPLYERHIGSRIVLEVDDEGKKVEYCGILKEYTADFIEVMDIQYTLDEQVGPRVADIIVPRKISQVRHSAEWRKRD